MIITDLQFIKEYHDLITSLAQLWLGSKLGNIRAISESKNTRGKVKWTMMNREDKVEGSINDGWEDATDEGRFFRLQNIVMRLWVWMVLMMVVYYSRL